MLYHRTKIVLHSTYNSWF